MKTGMKIFRYRKTDLFLKKGRQRNRKYAYGEYYLTLFSHRNQEEGYSNKKEKLERCLEWLKFRSPEIYNYITKSDKFEIICEVYYSYWGPGISSIRIKSKSYSALKYFRSKFKNILPYFVNINMDYTMLKDLKFPLKDYQYHKDLLDQYFPYKIDNQSANSFGISFSWGSYEKMGEIAAMINPISIISISNMTLNFITKKDMNDFLFYYKLNN